MIRCRRVSWIALIVLLVPGLAWAQKAELDAFNDAVRASPYPGKARRRAKRPSRLGTKRMWRANKMAAAIVKRRMMRQRGSDLELVRKAGGADVIVVSGSYDRVQHVLRALDIKHVVIPPHLLPRLPLVATQTLLINCPGRLPSTAKALVRQFVKGGGYLVTTDWALTFLQQTFPGYVKRAGRNTKNDVVKVRIHHHRDPMLKHVRTLRVRPRWWLESGSFPIKVLNRSTVKVLISSREMRRKYGHDPIAVTFPYGQGKILHMTSHFYLQQAKVASKIERKGGTTLAKAAGLRGVDLRKLRRLGLGKVELGALYSAYSMQQLTANVLVSRARSKRKILKGFRLRAKHAFVFNHRARGSTVKARKDFRFRVLRKRGHKVLVRDLMGNEGWVPRRFLH